MSKPVQTDRTDIHRGDRPGRTRRVATPRSSNGRSSLTATTAAKPERAVAYGDIPTAAVLAAAESVRTWHAAQRPADLTLEVSPGVTLERRWTPLRSVGIYVPKGLVSSLIMGAVPAQVAGVERIVVCTPPSGAAAVAAAAALLGIDEVWAIGGAQAIAAMAYGTESIAPGRQDLRTRRGSGQRREAAGQPRRRDRPARRTERDRRRRRRGVRRGDHPAGAGAPRWSTAPIRGRTWFASVTTSTPRLPRSKAYAAEHVALLGVRAESLAGPDPQRRRGVRRPVLARSRR